MVAAQKILIYTRLNLLLLALLLLLAAAAWFLQRDTEPTQTRTLTSLDPDAVQYIRIDNGGGRPIDLVRQSDGWRMRRPYDADANAVRVERLLAIATAPLQADFPLPGKNLAQFGLAEPSAELRLDETSIRVGGTDPVNHHRYLAIDGRIVLIRDHYPHLLLAAAEHYVTPRLIAPGAGIEEIATPGWRLRRQTGALGVWQLEPPVEGISSDLLTEKVDAWRNAQALRIRRFEAGPRPPLPRVRLKLSGREKSRDFSILESPEGDRLLWDAQSDLVYEIPGIEALLSPPGSEPTVP